MIVRYYDFWYCLNDKIFIRGNVLLFVNQELDATEITESEKRLTLLLGKAKPVTPYFNRAACVVLQVVFKDCKTKSFICSIFSSTNSAEPSVGVVKIFNSNS